MYLIIGSGRAATHFSYYFSLKKIPFIQWSRKANSLAELESGLAAASKVLLLIRDSDIESFFQQRLLKFHGLVIHASGAIEVPGTISAHPLMSFGPEYYSLDIYENIGFAVGPETDFRELLPELRNPFFQINSSDKALYHAWAVYSGNLATLLWQEALRGFAELKVPPSAVEAYLLQVLNNVMKRPELALTGPLARKDKKTISLHLKNLPEPARHIYQCFVDTYASEFRMEVMHDANS